MGPRDQLIFPYLRAARNKTFPGHPGKPSINCPVVNVADLSDLLGQGRRKSPYTGIRIIKRMNHTLVPEGIDYLEQYLAQSSIKGTVAHRRANQLDVCIPLITIHTRMLKCVDALE